MQRPSKQAFISGAQLAARASLAAALSIGIATAFRLPYPIYALIAAVIVTDFEPSQTRRLGFQRLIATIIGAVCGALLRSVLEPTAWSIGLGILVAMVVCQQSRAPEGAKSAGFISGIIMLDVGANTWSYALFRFIETVLGISVAWAISFVPRLIRFEQSTNGETDTTPPA